MSRTLDMKIASPQQESGAIDLLEITVVPVDGKEVGGRKDPLRFQFDLPAAVLPESLLDAAEDADEDASRLAPCDEALSLSGGEGNWTAWVRASGNDALVMVQVCNDLDEDMELVKSSQRGKLDGDDAMTLRVNLSRVEERVALNVNYRFGNEYVSDKRGIRYNQQGALSLWMLPEGEDQPDKLPVVDLYSDAESPTALKQGESVLVSWEVEGGLRGKLLGPLPSGQVLELKQEGRYRIEAGSQRVQVLGPIVYQLQAVVKQGDEELEVSRFLFLDIVGSSKYAAVRAVPSTLLPNGALRIFWYASWVNRATLLIDSIDNFTPIDEDHPVSDKGYFDVTREVDRNLVINLEVTLDNDETYKATDNVIFLTWDKLSDALPEADLPHAGQSAHLAHFEGRTGSHLLYAAGDSVFLADSNIRVKPKRVDVEVQILAVVEGLDGFILLHRKDGDLKLTFLKPGNETEITVLNGPRLDSYYHSESAQFTMARLEDRLYLSVTVNNKYLMSCSAWSLDLKARDGWTFEPRLAGLAGFGLVANDVGLYGYHRDNGLLVRLMPGESTMGGSLAGIFLCEDPPGSIQKGTAVGVDSLVLFLGSDQPLDLVYNAQTNHWERCGSQFSAVGAAVYRGGSSGRMWAVREDGLYTLSVGSPKVFYPNYRRGRPGIVPQKPLFDQVLEIQVENHSGGKLLPLSARPHEFPFAPVGWDQPTIVSEVVNPGEGESASFKLEYNSERLPAVYWFWHMEHWPLLAQLQLVFAVGKLSLSVSYSQLQGAEQLRVHNLCKTVSGEQVTFPPLTAFARLHLFNGTEHVLKAAQQSAGFKELLTTTFGYMGEPPKPIKYTLESGPRVMLSGRVEQDFSLPPGIKETSGARLAVISEDVNNPRLLPGLIKMLEADHAQVQFGGEEVTLDLLPGHPNYLVALGQVPAFESLDSQVLIEQRRIYKVLLSHKLVFATRLRIVLEYTSLQPLIKFWEARSVKDPTTGRTINRSDPFFEGTSRQSDFTFIGFSQTSDKPILRVKLTPEYEVSGTVISGETIEVPHVRK